MMGAQAPAVLPHQAVEPRGHDRELCLTAVHGRDGAGPEGRPRGRLHGLSITLGPGLFAVLGTPEDGTLALLEVATGRARPSSGQVTLAHREPWRSPRLRAHIAAVHGLAELPEAPTVAMAIALAARAGSWDVGQGLAELGLDGLAARTVASLQPAEARSVELAIALHQPAPWLVILYEPFRDLAGPAPAVVRQRLRALASQGACVVVLTSSPDDAIGLTEHWMLLRAGRVLSPVPTTSRTRGAWQRELMVWVSPEVAGGGRALASALHERRELTGVAWYEGHGADRAEVVAVRGPDVDAAALAVLDACAELGTAVRAIHGPAVSLELLVQQALAVTPPGADDRGEPQP